MYHIPGVPAPRFHLPSLPSTTGHTHRRPAQWPGLYSLNTSCRLLCSSLHNNNYSSHTLIWALCIYCSWLPRSLPLHYLSPDTTGRKALRRRSPLLLPSDLLFFHQPALSPPIQAVSQSSEDSCHHPQILLLPWLLVHQQKPQRQHLPCHSAHCSLLHPKDLHHLCLLYYRHLYPRPQYREMVCPPPYRSRQ